MITNQRVLYNSSDVYSEIQRLFTDPLQKTRRIIAVAYVGADALAFLPTPAGCTIICCPQPGATSAEAIRRLQERGAEVFFTDRLHAKVYWSQRRGCLITSANLSRNALGMNGLKEVGILIPDTDFDIDRFLKGIKLYEADEDSLLELSQRTEQWDAQLAPLGLKRAEPIKQFRDWLGSSFPETVKLGWWSDSYAKASKQARNWANKIYGVTSVRNYINVTPRAVAPHQWILTFRLTEKRAYFPSWFYVNHVVSVHKSDQSYEKEYPSQAIQVHALKRCPSPPFELTSGFKKAFVEAIAEYGLARIENDNSLTFSPKLKQMILQKL